MKQLLTFLFSLISVLSLAQSERTDDYVTKNIKITEAANGEGPYTWNIRIHYHAGDPTKRPTLFIHNGAGEIGQDTTFFIYPSQHSFGWDYFMSNGSGYDGRIKLGNGIHYVNLINIMPPLINMRPWHLAAIVDTLIKNYAIDTLNMGFAGLSMGSQEWQYLMMYYPTAGDEHWMKRMRCFVDLQGEGGDLFPPYNTGPGYPNALGHWAKRYGGHMFGVEGTNDSRNIWQLTQNMRDSTGNKEYFVYENWNGNTGPGTHGGWNFMYDPTMNNWIDSPAAAITNPNLVYSTNPQSTIGTYKRDAALGTNIFQWMLRQMPDTSLKVNSPVQYMVGVGEYQVFFLNPADSFIYARSTNVSNIGTGGVVSNGKPIKVSAGTTKFKFVAGSLHAGAAIDINGTVWTWGENPEGQLGNGTTSGTPSTTPFHILTDSLGNSFNNVVKLVAGYAANAYSMWYAIKADGTLWAWGPLFAGMRGDGTYGNAATRPVQLPVPSGKTVADVKAGAFLLVLCTDGTAYTCGGNGGSGAGNASSADLGNGATGIQWLSFKQVSALPAGITDITGGIKWSFGYNRTTNKLYGWGTYGDYLGKASQTAISTPVELTEIENTFSSYCPTCTIKQIETNSECTVVILSDGSAWAFGDNPQGNIGDGTELNYSDSVALAASGSTFYSFNLGTRSVKMQVLPKRIMPNIKNFASVTGGSHFVYYRYLIDSLGNTYSWGRNKTGVLANGIVPPNTNGAIEALYSNSWDVTLPTLVKPFTDTTTYVSTSPYCIGHPGGSPCSLYTIPANTKPSVSFTLTLIAGNKLVLNSSGTTDNVHVSYNRFTQKAGATLFLGDRTSTKDTVQAAPGTYTIGYLAIDNGWLSDSLDQTITIGLAPTVTPGGPYTITLPTNSQTISVTASGNGGATITGYNWQQTTKPVGAPDATIANGNTANALVANLVAGVYTFTCTVTDSNTNTADGVVTVTVNPAPPPSNCNCTTTKYKIIVHSN